MSLEIVRDVVNAFDRDHADAHFGPCPAEYDPAEIDTYRIKALALAGCRDATETIREINRPQELDVFLEPVRPWTVPYLLTRVIAQDLIESLSGELDEAKLRQLQEVLDDTEGTIIGRPQ